MTKTCLAPALMLAALAFGASRAGAQALPPSQIPPPAASSTVVSEFRGSIGHTGVAAESLSAPLSLLWRHTALASANNPVSAVYAASTVYFASGGSLFALSASDGSTQWQYPANGKPGPTFGSTPAYDAGSLYVTDDSGQVYKLDAVTGKLVWKVKLDGTLRSSPVISEGIVFFGSSNSHCYALSAATGQTLWDVVTNGAVATSRP